HYCSKKCSQQHHAIKNNSGCQRCSGLVKRGNRYCSDCVKIVREELAAERRTINDVVLCQYCRKKFQTSNAQMHKINHGIDCEMFCSKSCADNAHRERMIKDGNPNWKGGAEVYTAEFKKVIGPKV